MKQNFSVPKELFRLSKTTLQFSVLQWPLELAKLVANTTAFDRGSLETSFVELVGKLLLSYVDQLGPLYGKILQILVNGLSPEQMKNLHDLQLDRVLNDWPAIAFHEVQEILDREIPNWRAFLEIEKSPLGVASMGQVHAAKDHEGREWVVKILKPKSIKRMRESVRALESILHAMEPFAVTLSFKKAIHESLQLCAGFRSETSLTVEKQNIERAQENFKEKKSRIIRIPKIHPTLCTEHVLVIERFHGFSISDVLTGKVTLTDSDRKELAQDVLKELLVQIFEWGMFHADPHAGNLMILREGGIGLFDWGLTGELTSTDRKHIAGILRAVMTLDRERLVDVLLEMAAQDEKATLNRDKIDKEITRVMEKLKKKSASDAKPSLQQMMEICLNAADKLKIRVPNGLLMMAKTLLTVEALARGIDINVSLTRVATPVLFRAAKPSVSDVVKLVVKSPNILRKVFQS